MKKKLLASILAATLLLCSAAPAFAADPADPVVGNDENGIPDPNLYAAALQSCDSNEDGILTESECANCSWLSVYAEPIKSLKGITLLSNLANLTLYNCEITAADELAQMTSLYNLNLAYNSLTSIEFAAPLAKLNDLDVSNNLLKSIDAVSGLTELKSLKAGGNQLKEIDCVSSLNRLEYLSVADNWLTQLPDLTFMKDAENPPVYLVGNFLPESALREKLPEFLASDEEWIQNALSNQKQLPSPDSPVIPNSEAGIPDQKLYAAILERADVNGDGLLSEDEAGGLDTLEIPAKEISSLDGINKLKNLSLLNVSNNELTELSPMDGMKKLDGLILSGNRLSSLEGIDALQSIFDLDVSNNKLTSLKGIEGLDDIFTLEADNNQLTTLEGLESIPLYRLSASHNQLIDIGALASAETLFALDVSYNELSALPDLTQTNLYVFGGKSAIVDFGGTGLDFRYNHLTEAELRAKLPAEIFKEDNWYSPADWMAYQMVGQTPPAENPGGDDEPVFTERIDDQSVKQELTQGDATVSLTQPDTLRSELLAQAKASGHKLTVRVADKDKNIRYIWNFDGAQLGDDLPDIDLAIETGGDYPSLTGLLPADAVSLVLNFSYSGELPVGTSLKLAVGDTYDDGESLYLYYFNSKTGSLELCAENLIVENGLVSFPLTHCSQYVLSNQAVAVTPPSSKPEELGVENNVPQTGEAAVLLLYALPLLAAGAALFLRAKSIRSKSRSTGGA